MQLTLNAWTGSGPARGEVIDAARWALRNERKVELQTLAPELADPRSWQNKNVGWGVVMADGARMPNAIKRLVTHRKGTVFHYIADWEKQYTHLRNTSTKSNVAITGSPVGTGARALPQYLLIYGAPTEVPWQLQYILNNVRSVGRLHLKDAALDRYVHALMSDWESYDVASNRALVWSVVDTQDEKDITHLMRNAIAEPIVQSLEADDQIGKGGVRFLDGGVANASAEQFTAALNEHQPGLVVTTSHGMAGPTNNRTALANNLGLLVDHTGGVLDPNDLLTNWAPAGAIWYSHACYSAGCDSAGYFENLLEQGSSADDMWRAIKKLGASVAPLPTALLSAKRPARAFIGHVEPTFDWTLEDQYTGQFLTTGIVDALYTSLFVSTGDVESPAAYAFRNWFAQTAGLRAQYTAAQVQFNRGADTDNILLSTQLASRDIEATVLIGDPTVALPGLPN